MKSPYFQPRVIKVFIPTYKREQAITTHRLFLDARFWDLKVVVHTEEDKAEYLKHNPELEERILVSNAVGIAGQRAFIDAQVAPDEWYVSGDDDIEAITGVKPELYNLPEMPQPLMTKENYGHVYSEPEYRKVFYQMMEISERAGLRLFGFNSIDNPFFRGVKYRKNAFIIGVLWATKKSSDWSIDTAIKLKEDYERTAKHFLYHGGTLRNDYVSFKTKMYADGGVGSLKDRTPQYEASAEMLIRNYPGLFEKNISRGNPHAEVRIIPRTDSQVAMWRLKMIVKGLLPREYIDKILGAEPAKAFRKKFKI